jgi:hypothetical protein
LNARTIWIALACVALGGCSRSVAAPASSAPSTDAAMPDKVCATDEECPKEAPFCAAVDRFGELVGHGDGHCVGRCSNGRCPAGQRCLSQPYIQTTIVDGKPKQVVAADQICVPEAHFGSARFGQTCHEDADCARASPYCMSGDRRPFCTRACDSGCPARFRCGTVGHLSASGMETSQRCVRSTAR